MIVCTGNHLHMSALILLMACLRACEAITLLRDLPTPSFLVHLDALKKTYGTPTPPISLPNQGFNLVPESEDYLSSLPNDRKAFAGSESESTGVDVFQHNMDSDGSACYGYVHTRVIQSRSDSFLVELDLPPTFSSPAHLVLGLNNHHVISYYWARSAGSGAAMEAPGIFLDGTYLKWESQDGFTACNSNDGKRSEWVNFLRVGDQVQLRPSDPASCILDFKDEIYGISSEGRPLGAEPYVTCRFALHPIQHGNRQ